MHESTRYLLVGGGLASVAAAQAIRERDPEGRIVIVGKEKHPPYDRPPLSKQYLAGDDLQPDDAYSKADDFYPNNRVQLLTGVKAARIDRAGRTVHMENGDSVTYEKLLLATGSDPRSLGVPGDDLKGVYYLRTIEEAEEIRLAMQHSRRVAIVGSGYIGMEVASGACQRGLETTIVDRADTPWSRFASPALGGFMRRYYEGKGVRFLLGEPVTALSGNGRFEAVTTAGGKQAAADFAVVGAGVTLNLDLAKEAGLQVDERDGVVVNEFLETSDPAIWAAGDIACFQDVALGKRWHAEHFLNARWQGRAAGAIMAGERKPYDQVPYFFSDIFDIHMVLRGDPQAGKETIVLGDLESGEFVELYPGPDGALAMGVAISHEEKKLDPISDKLEELIRAKAPVGEIGPGRVGLA